jgi:hypothetical protein
VVTVILLLPVADSHLHGEVYYAENDRLDVQYQGRS